METVNIQRWNKYICCQKRFFSSSMCALFEDLDEALANSTLLKNDATSTVGTLLIDDQQIVIKRSNTKGLVHFIRRLFQTSRARINWNFAQHLPTINVATFEPIAVVEERFGPFCGRSYFVCSHLKGTDALHYFAHGALPQQDWPMVAKEIVLLIKRLASGKLYHQDLNLSNIILINNKPFLIDLDSMRHYKFRWRTESLLKKLWRRFMENWDEMPGVSSEVAPLFQETLHKLENFKC